MRYTLKVYPVPCFVTPSKAPGSATLLKIPSFHFWLVAIAKWCVLGYGRREEARLGDTTAVGTVAATTDKEMKSLR